MTKIVWDLFYPGWVGGSKHFLGRNAISKTRRQRCYHQLACFCHFSFPFRSTKRLEWPKMEEEDAEKKGTTSWASFQTRNVFVSFLFLRQFITSSDFASFIVLRKYQMTDLLFSAQIILCRGNMTQNSHA